MEKVKPEEVFGILSNLLDELRESGENHAADCLNEIQLMVDEKLIPSIEKIQYEEKYKLIERIQDICKDIALCQHFSPEIINTTMIGIYEPDSGACKNLYKKILKDSLEQELADGSLLEKLVDRVSGAKAKYAISDSVITIFHGKQEQTAIRVLNLAEKVISLSNKDYLRLLNYAGKEELDLAQLSHAIAIPSEKMHENQAYMVFPHGVDKNKKYYIPALNAVDVLVIKGTHCKANVLSAYRNLSKVLVYGELPENNKIEAERYCQEKQIEIGHSFHSFSDVLDEINSPEYQVKKNNFCYLYYLESILQEIGWYLALRKAELQEPMKDINDNLLYKDDISYECIKRMQSEYREDIELTDRLYGDYKSICDELLGKIAKLQEMMGIKEGAGCMNDHIKMDEILLDLIIKMSESLKAFPEANSKEKVRRYASLYAQVSGNSELATALLNDFLGIVLRECDLAALRNARYSSPFFLRKKLTFYEKIGLGQAECGEIVLKIGTPLRTMEKRLLGEYYLSQGKQKQAKEILMSAAMSGDAQVGTLLIYKCNLSAEELLKIADYGVAAAAFHIGEELCAKVSGWPKEAVAVKHKDCLKYLHIAASKKHLPAIKLLGDISYENCDANPEEAKKALHYYLIAMNDKSSDFAKQAGVELNGKIGDLYFLLENYKESIQYLEKADTAESNYLLGVVYENGYGCAANDKKALAYYEKAINKGHMEAQVAYERLNAKIEEEQRKNVIRENQSYSSYSYYSGGYYYYSGW